MTTQPLPLRLADAMENKAIVGNATALELGAAAELRRLHEEVTLLCEQNTELDKKLAELETLNQELESVCNQRLRHIEKLKKRLAKAEGRA